MKMYLILILESVGFDPALGYVTQEWQLSGISCWLCCSGSSSPGCDTRCWCLPKNDALRKGCKECLQIFSASSILFKVCFVKIWGSVPSFWIPNSYFFKSQNLQWGSNDQQQCLFNTRLGSSLPSWKSTKESMKKSHRNMGWHSPGIPCLVKLVFTNYPRAGSGDGVETSCFSLKNDLLPAVLSIPSHEASTLTEESQGCSCLLFVLCLSPFRSPETLKFIKWSL